MVLFPFKFPHPCIMKKVHLLIIILTLSVFELSAQIKWNVVVGLGASSSFSQKDTAISNLVKVQPYISPALLCGVRYSFTEKYFIEANIRYQGYSNSYNYTPDIGRLKGRKAFVHHSIVRPYNFSLNFGYKLPINNKNMLVFGLGSNFVFNPLIKRYSTSSTIYKVDSLTSILIVYSDNLNYFYSPTLLGTLAYSKNTKIGEFSLRCEYQMGFNMISSSTFSYTYSGNERITRITSSANAFSILLLYYPVIKGLKKSREQKY